MCHLQQKLWPVSRSGGDAVGQDPGVWRSTPVPLRCTGFGGARLGPCGVGSRVHIVPEGAQCSAGRGQGTARVGIQRSRVPYQSHLGHSAQQGRARVQPRNWSCGPGVCASAAQDAALSGAGLGVGIEQGPGVWRFVLVLLDGNGIQQGVAGSGEGWGQGSIGLHK